MGQGESTRTAPPQEAPPPPRLLLDDSPALRVVAVHKLTHLKN
jgi:hypothetical protein